MAEQMGMDEFLGHSTREGGRGSYLGNWKKRAVQANVGGPHVDTWLHMRSSITAIWSFQWPRIVERRPQGNADPDAEKTREVWSGDFNSWENPAVLKRQYHLADKQTGELEVPPQLCPMARMIAAVRLAVGNGTLSWVDTLFEFVGDDPRKAQTYHAAGIYGDFKRDTYTDEERAELKEAKIFLRDAWKESMMARCQYLLQVCDNDEPQKGVQVALVGSLLGDKIKGVINDAMDAGSLGKERGNPQLHPYCIRWIHRPDEKEFGKKFHARRMDGIALTDAVRHVIEDEPPRDVRRDLAPGNVTELRLSMERHYVGPAGALNFDEIFAPAEELAERQEQAGDDDDPDAPPPEPKAQPARRPPARPQPAARPVSQATAAKAAREVEADLSRTEDGDDEPDGDHDEADDMPIDDGPAASDPQLGGAAPEEVYDCDECGAPMLASQTVCPACKFDFDPKPEPEPAPVPRRSRSQVTAAAKSPTPAVAKGEAKAGPAAGPPTRPAPRPFKPEESKAPAGRNRVKG